MKRTSLISLAVSLIATVWSSAPAQAQMLTTVDRGSYTMIGTLPALDGYLLSNSATRAYFVFELDIPSTAAITGATLKLWNPGANILNLWQGGYGGDATETVSIWDVTTSLTSLVSNGSPYSTFLDLGSGTLFGEATVGSSSEGSFVEFTLNSDFLDFISGLGYGERFALGASLTSDRAWNNEFVFAGSHTGNPADNNTFIELDLQTFTTLPAPPINAAVPEPSTYGLMGVAALAGLVAWRRRRARD